MLPGMVAVGVPTSVGSFSYTDVDVSGTNASSYNFTVTVGAARTGRVIVVAIVFRASPAQTISSVTIGGVSATLLVSAPNTASGVTEVALYSAAVPTGASPLTVAVSLTGTALRCGCGTWTCYDLTSPTAAADTATDIAGNPASLPLNVQSGDIVIGAAALGPSLTAAWTQLSENFDLDIEAAGNAMTGASAQVHFSGQIPVTVTYSGTTAVVDTAAAVALR